MLARLFEWFISSPPATLLTAVGAIILAMSRFRKQSRGEHTKTMTEIQKIGTQVNGGLIDTLTRHDKALERIERKLDRLGISEADQ